MSDLVASAIYECVGCTESMDPHGLDQLLAGLAFVALAMVPLAIVHLALRRRGR